MHTAIVSGGPTARASVNGIAWRDFFPPRPNPTGDGVAQALQPVISGTPSQRRFGHAAAASSRASERTSKRSRHAASGRTRASSSYLIKKGSELRNQN